MPKPVLRRGHLEFPHLSDNVWNGDVDCIRGCPGIVLMGYNGVCLSFYWRR